MGILRVRGSAKGRPVTEAEEVGPEGIVTLATLRSALQHCMRAMRKDAARPRA